MRSFLVQQVLAAGFLAAPATAVTPVSDHEMSHLLKNDGIGLAMKAQPMFLYGQALAKPPCVPTWALTKNDQQTPAAKLCPYPDVGCGCVKPKDKVGNPSQAFPVYFSYQACSKTSVRVAYNLFWEKDGSLDPPSLPNLPPNFHFGHGYDWERAIVVWAKGKDSQWRPDELLLSQHSDYGRLKWADIHSTFNEQDGKCPRGGVDGRKNLDHPKVYMEWYKHAMRDTKETKYTDQISQVTDEAFRIDDWWRFPERNDYIYADNHTAVGDIINKFNWGEADSTPPKVGGELCTIKI